MGKKVVRVLHIVPNMQAGGLETFIMNIYRNLDRNKIQFDFLVHYKEKYFYDDEIESLGGKIYKFDLRENNNIFKYMIMLNRFYKQHKEYKIIHCHMASIGFINFVIAKKNGINIRIAHSHNANTEKNIKGYLKRIMIAPYKFLSTINFACSDDAGKFLFSNKKYEVISNGISVEKFKYNLNARNKIRNDYNWDENFLVGHVGRFEQQKNHKFIIDLLPKVIKVIPNIKVILIGEGSLMDEIKKYSKEKNVDHYIEFLGVVPNVFDYYSAMDCFIFPSLFEGLGIVLIEAQSSGLPCIVSDRIPKEAFITNIIDKEDINNADAWVNKLMFVKKNMNMNKNRLAFNNIVNESEFSIFKTIEKLNKTYLDGKK